MRKKYVWIDDIIDGENNRKYNNDAYSISFDDLIIHDDEEMSVSEYLEQEEYK